MKTTIDENNDRFKYKNDYKNLKTETMTEILKNNFNKTWKQKIIFSTELIQRRYFKMKHTNNSSAQGTNDGQTKQVHRSTA